MNTENPDPAIPANLPEQIPVSSLLSIKERCDQMRSLLLDIEKEARRLKEHPAMKEPDTFPGQRSEMIAQSMLAVRHIEDARMRIGKVLQYGRDGVSIFDRPEPQP